MTPGSDRRARLGTYCPDCGTHISSARQADYGIADHSVRYVWFCEECVAEFETQEAFAVAA